MSYMSRNMRKTGVFYSETLAGIVIQPLKIDNNYEAIQLTDLLVRLPMEAPSPPKKLFFSQSGYPNLAIQERHGIPLCK
jgi:hypothetical protein